MLKRLLIAVFVIGLILAFGGTAFSDNLNREDAKQSTAVRHPMPSVVKLGKHVGTWPMNQPALNQKYNGNITPVPADPFVPAPASPDTTSCGIDYTTGVPGAFYNYPRWDGTATDRTAMSFDVRTSHEVQITGAKFRIYKVYGSPSLNIKIHQDNLGNPGTVVYTETKPVTVPPTGGTQTFTLTTPVTLSNIGSFWISVGIVGGASDSLYLGMWYNTAGPTTGRARYTADGINWVMSTAVPSLGNLDVDFRIASVACQWYTSCYSYVIDTRGMYGVPVPDGAFSDGSFVNGFAQRFVASGPETLTAVKVMTVDETAFGYPGQTFYGPASTNGLIVSVWADSSGSIDKSTGALYTQILPAGLANIYPATHNNGFAAPIRRDTAFVPFPGRPVLIGPYHITVQTTTSLPANGQPFFRLGVDNKFGGGSVNFTAPGATWERVATNPVFITEDITGGAPYDASWDIRPQLCRDEFSVCKNTVLYDYPAMYDYAAMTPTSIRGGFAQKIKGNPVNRVEKLRFQVDWDGGPATVGIIAKIWSASTYGPGTALYSQVVPNGSMTFYPGWTEVVIPGGGVQVLGDFYVGYEGYFVDSVTPDYFYPMSEDGAHAGTHVMQNGGIWDYRRSAPAVPNHWRSLADTLGYDDNMMAEAEFCSIPVQERPCVTENDWPTLQHDFARTGASGIALGTDAYCRLTLNWQRQRPTGRGVNLNGPIIWNSKIICAFSSATVGTYEVLDLATGATLYSFDAATWPDDIGGNIRCTPSLATVNVAGTPTPVLFLSGGNPGSIGAFDMSAFPVVTRLWSVNGNNGYLGHTAGMGATRYGNILFLTVGGTEVVYWAADDNLVYAAHASTGLPLASFKGGNLVYTPFNLGLSSQKSGATDGILLYYALFNTAGDGKVMAVNPANGTQAWVFPFGANTLKGASLFASQSNETFECGVAVADGEVYANSRMLTTVSTPRRGVMYRLKALDGSLLSATASDRGRTTHPTIDKNRVFVPTFPNAAQPQPAGGSMLAFRRSDGALMYATNSMISSDLGGQIGYFTEALLTCEPDSSDWLFAFNTAGYLSCYKADNGNERFSRRVEHGLAGQGSQGGVGAIGKDGLGNAHLVYTDLFGGIYDLTMQTARTRLEILVTGGVVAVPFASPADTVVTFKKVYTNTGCTPLVVSLTASTTTNGTRPPVAGGGTISSRLANNSSSLADQLTSGSSYYYVADNGVKVMGHDMISGDPADVKWDNARTVSNPAAAATPGFLNQNAGSYAGDVFVPAFGGIITNPGDTAGISVHANGPLVNRGPNTFYVEFTSINDPDYYIDNTARRPELFLTLVGGCLIDTTTLHFGAGGANKQLVINTSRLATGDWSDGPSATHGYTIDGHIEVMYQGYYTYAVSEARQALSSQDWASGGGEDKAWISSQANPNWCDGSCKPQLSSSVAMGSISTDGITYTAISGNVACRSYIDSVQNQDDGTGFWDWNIFGAPFDNDSTIGMEVKSKVYGVVSAPAAAILLNNLTLDIMTVSERNGRAVPGWKMGAYNDNDLGGPGGIDTAKYDGTHSVMWGVDKSGTGVVDGLIKIPFGCGYTPLKNAAAVNQAQWAYLSDGTCWDTNWVYMSKLAGEYSNNYAGTADQAWFATITEHDFLASGSYKFGVAFFGFAGMTDAFHSTSVADGGKIANAAILVNKWAGFGRGDVNNDGLVNLADIIYLATNVNYGGPSPIPFKHLGDVNASGGLPNMADVQYLVDFYFNYGPCAKGDWVI